MKVWIGIDNGISGSIGYITEKGDWNFAKVPIKLTYSYTKDRQKLNRIDHESLKTMLISIINKSKDNNIICYIEKPYTDPNRYKASISGMRAYESVIVLLEQVGIAYETISSKLWQKEILPGVKGSNDLKKASLETGKRLFPGIEKIKHSDYDGILIAEWMRRDKL